MGKKKISIRTLDTGEQVVDHPPSDEFPEGRQVLVPTRSLLDVMEAKQQEMADGSDQKLEVRMAAIDNQRQKLAAGNPVPEEKRVV